MSQEFNPNDNLSEFDKPKLPSSLNVLTILTIIGCSIGVLSSIYSFITAKKTYETMKETINSGKLDEAPKWARGMMNPEMLSLYRKMYENKLPILVLSLLALGLCFFGALEMRKMKKQGYTYWMVGEILPFATTIMFMGMSAFSGFGLLAAVVPLIFIILYTVNKKYLVY